MAVKGIVLSLATGGASDAGSDGDLYLGVGGREFYVDSRENDIERHSRREYVFGTTWPEALAPTNVIEAAFNDPSKPTAITQADVAENPVYLRFRGKDRDDNLLISEASVTIHTDVGGPLPPFRRTSYIWLGTRRGESVRLRQVTQS